MSKPDSQTTERSIQISIFDMLDALPRYGIGRSGQCYVKIDDVKRAVETFFDMKKRVSNV